MLSEADRERLDIRKEDDGEFWQVIELSAIQPNYHNNITYNNNNNNNNYTAAFCSW